MLLGILLDAPERSFVQCLGALLQVVNNVSVRADDHGHCVLAGKKANGRQRSNGAAGGGAGKADGLSTRKTVVRFCLCLCLSPSMSSEVRESAAKLDTNMLTKHQMPGCRRGASGVCVAGCGFTRG